METKQNPWNRFETSWIPKWDWYKHMAIWLLQEFSNGMFHSKLGFGSCAKASHVGEVEFTLANYNAGGQLKEPAVNVLLD